MAVKTALLITYHWPPSGGAGVHRWLKMAKYLDQFGWRLKVFTPSNPERPVEDTSLLDDMRPENEVLTHPIWEPYRLYKRFIGQNPDDKIYSAFISEEGSPSAMQQASVWLRGNLFVPDPRRFWIRPAARYLHRHLAEHRVDALISTGPPHSMHLIAERVAASSKLPWVADFRDPWTGIDYYHDLRLTKFANSWNRRLEQRVLQSATRLVAVSPSWAKDLEGLSGRKVEVITNGFDPEDFPVDDVKLDDALTICHFGSLSRHRNPLALWRALAALRDAGNPLFSSVQVRLYGAVDEAVLESAAAQGLADQVQVFNYLPHADIIRRMRTSRLLLLMINRTDSAAGVVPGKLFEYLGAGRPVLMVGPPEGDAAAILRVSGMGWIVDFDDSESVIAAIQQASSESLPNRPERDAVEIYSRRTLARQYAQVLNEVAQA
jgi:glycosyltransferase involved in cell wall biosynthesis